MLTGYGRAFFKVVFQLWSSGGRQGGMYDYKENNMESKEIVASSLNSSFPLHVFPPKIQIQTSG